MRLTTIIFLGFLYSFQPLFAAGPEQLIEQANTAYLEGQYSYAIELYESVLDQKLEAHGLYYNLGNAYFKDNRLGPAILNYERALRIKPGDNNTMFNLEIAHGRIVDRINDTPLIFYEKRWRSMNSSFSIDTWAKLALLFLALTLALFGGYLFFKTRSMKKAAFGLSLLGLLFMTISFFSARAQYYHTFQKKEAIIMAQRATAKSSPGDANPDLFVIHEGSKASITGELGDWVEIRLANGNIGWVKKTMLEVI